MSMTIFLCGHGSHDVADGFVTVPKNVSVVFYGHYMKTVVAGDTNKLLDGTYVGEPHNVVGPWKTCPNMTLHATTVDHRQQKQNAFNNGPGGGNRLIYFCPGAPPNKETLENIFIAQQDAFRIYAEQFGDVKLVWACCRSVRLKGRHQELADKAGVNAIDRFIARKTQLRKKERWGARSDYHGPVVKIGEVAYGMSHNY